MAHNINFNKRTGRYSFAAKGTAWHGLGKEMKSAMTTEQAIIEAGLDYEVRLAPVYADLTDSPLQREGLITMGDLKEVPTNFATFRDDTKEVFSIVGSRYEVVQNLQAFNFFDDIVGSKEAIIETAGALGKGQTIFITAKLPDYIKGPDGNAIEKYLLLYHTHDGTSSIQAMFTPVRVVCNNTLSMALRDYSNKISLRHTKSVHDRLKEGAKLLKLTNVLSMEYSSYFKSMHETAIDEETLYKYFATIMEIKPDEKGVISTRGANILDSIMAYHEDGPGQLVIAGTLYGAYNAVTGYFNNVKEYKSAEDKMEKTILGAGQVKSQKAFDLALRLMNN